jgi:hypothetical protein
MKLADRKVEAAFSSIPASQPEITKAFQQSLRKDRFNLPRSNHVLF